MNEIHLLAVMTERIPSISALRAFESAVRLGSFQKAALELSVTPTAVSHQIRSLEQQFNTRFFVRRVRALEVTPEAIRLAERIRLSLQQITSAFAELAENSVVRVDTTPSFAALWLVPRLAEFHQLHPGISVELSTSKNLVDLHADQRVDIAIRYGAKSPPDLYCKKIAGERFFAFASPGYRYEEIASAQLIECQWQANHYDEISWDKWLECAGIPTQESESLKFAEEHHVIQAGLASQGVILVSSLLANDALQRGWLRQIQPEIALEGRQYRALCLPEKAGREAIRVFIDWLVGSAGKAS